MSGGTLSENQISQLIKDLKKSDGRNEAYRQILSFKNDPRLGHALLEASQKKGFFVEDTFRIDAITLLKHFKVPESVPVLITLLNNRNQKLRNAAAGSLGKQGDRRATPLLIELLTDSDDNLNKAAAESLGELQDPDAVQPLIKILDHYLKSKHENRGLLFATVESLGKLKAQEAVESLLQVLADKDKFVASQAIKALGEIGDPRAIEPIKAFFQCVELTSLEASIVAKELIKLGYHPSDDLDAARLYMGAREWERLVHVGTAAIDVLVPILKDAKEKDKNWIHEPVAAVLRQIGWKPQTPEDWAALKHGGKKGSPSKDVPTRQNTISDARRKVMSGFGKVICCPLALFFLIRDLGPIIFSSQGLRFLFTLFITIPTIKIVFSGFGELIDGISVLSSMKHQTTQNVECTYCHAVYTDIMSNAQKFTCPSCGEIINFTSTKEEKSKKEIKEKEKEKEIKMNPQLITQIRVNMELKDTEELIKIYEENNTTLYSREAFEAVKQILKERGIKLIDIPQ
ncbi:MAG: HEAT repeat domain-containing protein [Proteobacteria bacterium]|nr:HEAT repeat domain-containing protein [Pseudomonadota bacterium]